MVRLSNKPQTGTEIKYVDREIHVSVPSEPIVLPPEIQIEYVDREVIKNVEVPVEVEKVIVKEQDLSPIHENLNKHNEIIVRLNDKLDKVIKSNETELEMQRRALIAIKTQRDIDRSRRLMLLRRIKKEQTNHKKLQFKLKLAIAASILISIASLIVKL